MCWSHSSGYCEAASDMGALELCKRPLTKVHWEVLLMMWPEMGRLKNPVIHHLCAQDAEVTPIPSQNPVAGLSQHLQRPFTIP